MESVKKLKEAVVLAESALVIISAEIEERTEELQSLNERIVKAKGILLGLDKSVKEAQATFTELNNSHTETLAETEKQIEIKKSELAGLSRDVETAKKSHSQFVKYEMEHRKALDSRDKSISEREDAVASVIGQLKRRKQIVSEIL